MIDRNRQIVISGDRSPSDLDNMEERLRSRLGWGLVADIHATDYELRLGILHSKADQAGAEVGDTVRVTLEQDTAPRTVDAPPDLKSALADGGVASSAFDGMSYSHQKEYVEWIESAKRPETRARRVAKAVSMIRDNRRLKG